MSVHLHKEKKVCYHISLLSASRVNHKRNLARKKKVENLITCSLSWNSNVFLKATGTIFKCGILDSIKVYFKRTTL